MALSIFKFEVNFSSLAIFFLGILLGGILIFLFIYFSSIFTSKNKISKKNMVQVSEDQIKELLNKSINTFHQEHANGEKIIFKDITSSIFSIIENTAELFYPNSKSPLLELTVDEIILLDKYIERKINYILNKPFVKYFKNIKISTIINKATKEKEETVVEEVIVETPIVEEKQPNIFKKFINKFTEKISEKIPTKEIKKFIRKNTTNKIIFKLYDSVCKVACSETYKIYSKEGLIQLDEEIEKNLND